MESDQEVKELEEVLSKSEFEPIESPVKRWFKKFRIIHKTKQNRNT